MAPASLRKLVARRVETLLEEATLTLKHLKTKEAIEQATINYQTEILRDALVGGVSHELRTPLASILGSCSVLNRMPAIRNDRQSRELVEAINEQAGQLDNEIRNLLDAARISAKGVRPQLIWTDPTDIVSAALKQKERKTRLASGHCRRRPRGSAGPRRYRSWSNRRSASFWKMRPNTRRLAAKSKSAAAARTAAWSCRFKIKAAA